MPKVNWETTTNRFVSFFDILGFKDLVVQNSHATVLKKLEVLKKATEELEGEDWIKRLNPLNVDNDQTKSVTFSDSLIIFSKGGTDKDAYKLIADSYEILRTALKNGISIKGAISYGEITVNFEKSLFFGRPIIDAYVLHEELQMLTVIFDHHFDARYNTIKTPEIISDLIVEAKAHLKSGRITHKLLKPFGTKSIDSRIRTISKLYNLTSGRSRLYIDNTVEFLKSIKPNTHA